LGADVNHDITALREHGLTWGHWWARPAAGVVLMHMRAPPNHADAPPSGDIVAEAAGELRQAASGPVKQGIKDDHILSIPGLVSARLLKTTSGYLISGRCWPPSCSCRS